MDEYQRLRARARLKRDKAIAKAGAEYKEAVKKIKELERTNAKVYLRSLATTIRTMDLRRSK